MIFSLKAEPFFQQIIKWVMILIFCWLLSSLVKIDAATRQVIMANYFQNFTNAKVSVTSDGTTT